MKSELGFICLFYTFVGKLHIFIKSNILPLYKDDFSTSILLFIIKKLPRNSHTHDTYDVAAKLSFQSPLRRYDIVNTRIFWGGGGVATVFRTFCSQFPLMDYISIFRS